MATKTTTAKKSTGFSDAEKAAARARVQELKSAAGGADREMGENDVRAKLADMPQPDRGMGDRLQELISSVAPDLWQKTYYGMPGFATPGKNGKMICWFKPASKFKIRYATLEFSADAKLDDGKMWPVSWAVGELTPSTEKEIVALVRKAIS